MQYFDAFVINQDESGTDRQDSLDGVGGSIVARQAKDPGSSPGWASIFLFGSLFLENQNTRTCIVIYTL